MVILVPHLGPAFLIHRYYHVSLFYLAPFCIVGGEKAIRYGLKFICVKHTNNKSLLFVATLLMIIFLFKIGFVSEIFKDAIEAYKPIYFIRMKTSNNNQTKALFYENYVPEQDIYSAIWLSRNVRKNFYTYADFISIKHVLIGYGMIIIDWKYLFSNNTSIKLNANIYLRTLNVKGILESESTISKINVSHLLNISNKVYSNGDSEILQCLSINA